MDLGSLMEQVDDRGCPGAPGFDRLSYAVFAEKRASVGFGSLISQYVLNPSLSVSDVYFVLSILIAIMGLRFALAGVYRGRLRNLRTVFGLLFDPLVRPKQERKFYENLWYATWHSSSFCFGLYVLYCEGMTSQNPGWVRAMLTEMNVKWYWFPTPAEVEIQGNPGWPLFPVSDLMRRYYLTELGFWISCLLYLWIETKRDDFYIMMLHHFLTITLVIFSYCASFWRIGSVILITHDVADIWLYSAKSAYYAKTPTKVVDALFVGFAAAFFVSRLVIFPIFCVRPAVDSSQWNVWSGGLITSHADIPGGYAMPLCLCGLQALHVFWFGLIIRMIMRALSDRTVTQGGDIRSEIDEDEVRSDISYVEDEVTAAEIVDAPNSLRKRAPAGS